MIIVKNKKNRKGKERAKCGPAIIIVIKLLGAALFHSNACKFAAIYPRIPEITQFPCSSAQNIDPAT
jgi:hypothetical protein